MTNTWRRGLLEIEIDTQRKTLQQIKEDNRIFDTLETDKTALVNEEKRWFFMRKTFFFYSIYVDIFSIVNY